MPARHTQADLEVDLELLHRSESGETQWQIAESIGLDRSQVSRRLARARRYRQELGRVSERGHHPCETEDLPYVALTDDPGRERGEYYILDGVGRDPDEHSICSVQRGSIRIANRLGTGLVRRNVNDERRRVDDEEKPSQGRDLSDEDERAGVVYVQGVK